MALCSSGSRKCFPIICTKVSGMTRTATNFHQQSKLTLYLWLFPGFNSSLFFSYCPGEAGKCVKTSLWAQSWLVMWIPTHIACNGNRGLSQQGIDKGPEQIYISFCHSPEYGLSVGLKSVGGIRCCSWSKVKGEVLYILVICRVYSTQFSQLGLVKFSQL